jgi:hypothetical protein
MATQLVTEQSSQLPAIRAEQLPAVRPAEPTVDRTTSGLTDWPPVSLLVFGLVLLQTLPAGRADPAVGFAVFVLGLLGALIIDFVIWRRTEPYETVRYL